MKTRKLSKRSRALFSTLLVAALFFAAAAGILAAKGRVKAEEPFGRINENRSAVYLTGKNYYLDSEQEEAHLEEAQKAENRIEERTVAERLMENTENRDAGMDEPNPPESGEASGAGPAAEHSGGGAPEHGEGADKPGTTGNKGDAQGEGQGGAGAGGSGEETKAPLIICSLSDGQKVSGGYISFTVQAKDYKGNYINAFYITVLLNGEKLYSSGTTNNVVTYRNPDSLNDGINEISVSAVDREGHAASKRYILNADTEGERPKGGTVSVFIEAKTIGKGVIASRQIPFYEGENAAMVADRFLRDCGFAYESTGTFAYGFYLARVYIPGIAKDYKIPEKLKDMLDSENISETNAGFYNPASPYFHPDNLNSLGEKDFYIGSGWIYMLNGEILSGMAGTPVSDGDELHLGFTLYNLCEYNGIWFVYGEW